MRLIGRAVLAAAAFLAASAFVTPPSAIAAELACPEAQQFEIAKAFSLTARDKGTFTDVTVMETMAEVDAFLTTINVTYGRDIPLGKADKAIVLIVPDGPNAGIMAFGYRDGCQVWFLIVRGTYGAGTGDPDAGSDDPPPRRYGI
ncbi:MAG: hypothetical protein F9K43_18640 [Bauldia sp.]|nr:MAG: hypothetical protein F9K43_18640 [Bauldia sp.]